MTVLQYVYKTNGQIIQDLTIIPTKRGHHGFLAMPCQPLCGLNLSRPHLTCLNCRTRKAYYTGKAEIKIWQATTFTLRQGTPQWRCVILKALASLYAFISG